MGRRGGRPVSITTRDLEDVALADDYCPVCLANVAEGEPHDTGCPVSGARDA